MQKIILALGLLAVCALAQNFPPPPPAPAPPGGPPMPGRGRGEGEGQGEGEGHGEGEMEDKEPCPPKTGREWVCMMDTWDPNENRVIDSMDMQKCDERDECYLGPIVQRYLNDPWRRKWMCGPKPCQWEGSIEGRYQSGMNECHAGSCTIGPHDIMINGTWEVRAMFCDHESDEMGEEMEGEMEEMMGPMWADPVCSVNSSLNGEEIIKSCEGGELCMRGPAYTFYKGTQYRVFMCTKTPSMHMPMMMSKTEQIFHKIHYALSKVADSLVMAGYVFRTGPHETMYHVVKQLMVLRNHLEYYEKKAKEMKEMGGDGKIMLPEYVTELFNPLHLTVIKMHNQVVASLGAKAEDVMKPLRDVMDEFYTIYKGEPDITTFMDLVHLNIQRLVMKIREKDLMSEDARTMYRSAHEIIMQTFDSLKGMGFDEDRLMEIKKDMGEAMVYVWMHMTGGHVAPGNTPETLASKIIGAFQRIQEMMMSKMSPREIVEAAGMYLHKLKDLAMEGRLSTQEGRELHDMVATGKLLPLRRLTDSLPNTRMLTPMLTEVVNNFNILWNHITGGPTPSMSRPEMEIQKIWQGLEALVEHIEEGERMMREMRDRQPRQDDQWGGGGGQGPAGGNMMREMEDRFEELFRRLGHDDDDDDDDGPGYGGQGHGGPGYGGQGQGGPGYGGAGQGGPGQGGPGYGGQGQGGPGYGGQGQGGPGYGGPGGQGPQGGRGNDDMRRMLEDLQRAIRDMMDMGHGGPGQGGPGQGGPGQGGPGQGGPGQGGPGQGGPGGQGPQGDRDNDDMRRILEDLQRTMRDMMDMDRNGDRDGDRDSKGDEGMMDMMDMMGQRQGGGMSMRDMKAMSKADPMFHVEEPCDQPIWMRQIPMMDRMKWGRTDDTFLGPMPEESDDSKK